MPPYARRSDLNDGSAIMMQCDSAAVIADVASESLRFPVSGTM